MTRATVTGGKLNFGSPLTEARFLKQAEGKEVRLEIMEKPTYDMRKYFEGCLVPAFYYLHPNSGWKNFADAREVLKLEFAPGTREIALSDGSRIKVAPSSASLTKKRFGVFVEAVTEWMIEQGVDPSLVDSQEFKRWRDTNFTDFYYPPLKRLKDSYERSRGLA